jgi:hypothetical protein
MKLHLDTRDANDAEGAVRAPLGLRILFLIAGAVAVIAAHAPVAALAARIIG